MGKTKASDSSEPVRKSGRPSLTPQGKENYLISLAIDQVEEQLLNRTASSQVVTHFLKLATEKEALEREKLKNENELLLAKVKALESQERTEAMYQEALKAMSLYNGQVYYDED
jgi:hypothetical protein